MGESELGDRGESGQNRIVSFSPSNLQPKQLCEASRHTASGAFFAIQHHADFRRRLHDLARGCMRGTPDIGITKIVWRKGHDQPKLRDGNSLPLDCGLTAV